MELVSSLHMNGSEHGRNSYANNSILQREVIRKTRTMVKQTINTMKANKSFPEEYFVMADMGCSSGPNTLLSVSHVLEAVAGSSSRSPPRELQVFLNDLPSNDFNSIFLKLPQKAGCYVSGTPGSFYGRLFPTSTLHFVYSSYSLHFLSQVPEGIEDNRGHIHVARTSPCNVFEAYTKQFNKDFSEFLSHRAKELKPRGGMFLVLIGRSSDDPSNKDSCLFWELLSKSLIHMADQGKIEQGNVDSFNLPFYSPSKREVEEIVEGQGSFNIERLCSFEANWDYEDVIENEKYVFDEHRSGENVSNYMRAVTESMLTSRFGSEVMEELFSLYAKYVGEHLSMEKTMFFNIAISLTKNN